ncbi:hypothetical protein PGT21_019031 [Puccinia graminis f. sp. tritici]|uniref:Uncharacterized protein n=1 Tax=Puccinia graminis f. sp. tritici TaxID=56615 RepID=A0A5B0NTV6_PUCGR|nr:hypothetical protein PGT21_019031 [Puccinia graminis f. sp. tritici]KAA1092096.1 hypothetical protein PGTUg99_018517 [Puccinia graminis f. sp. tritici]
MTIDRLLRVIELSLSSCLEEWTASSVAAPVTAPTRTPGFGLPTGLGSFTRPHDNRRPRCQQPATSEHLHHGP